MLWLEPKQGAFVKTAHRANSISSPPEATLRAPLRKTLPSFVEELTSWRSDLVSLSLVPERSTNGIVGAQRGVASVSRC